MNHSIHTEATIDSSHHLTLDYDSPCSRIHGHTFRIEVDVRWCGSNLPQGMLVDFARVKAAIRRYDHQDLNTLLDQPTAENIAAALWEKIATMVPARANVAITVWETATSWARCEATV